MRRVRLFCMVVLALFSSSSRGDIEIEPAKPFAFYLAPNERADLVFNVTNLPAGKELKYAVCDYWGQPKREATAVVDSGNTVTVPVEFATGYYEISFPRRG